MLTKAYVGEKGESRQKAYNRYLTHGHTLTVEQQVLLLRMYARKEVKFSINANKSLGPGGYVSGFFRETWQITGGDLTDEVLEILRSRRMLKQINATIIIRLIIQRMQVILDKSPAVMCYISVYPRCFVIH